MTWNERVRRTHRWLAIAFTVTIVVTVVTLALKGPVWVSYVPLAPLALLLLSGLGIFVLSYAATRRSRAATIPQAGASRASAPRVRQLHRGSGIVFVATVIATFVALAQEQPVVWVSYLPLLPLALLLFSGLYMLVGPYSVRRRSARRAPQPG
ncbi:hypothetical protein ABZ511_20340 [Nocardia gamkensis]|uniref:hypothetical protein n=1 Tax=Nocardia gamkensis TaxID=352869 RepID=UPI003410841E